ncbi:MAG: hypothetical protein KDK70_39620, partial [Myxococcales bacterium]|nr:hypothetical protein [Myxococcales bacterium]
MTEPEHPLEPLVLDQPDPRARGRAQGEHWRDSVRALAEARLRLTVERGPWDSAAAVLRAADACLAR